MFPQRVTSTSLLWTAVSHIESRWYLCQHLDVDKGFAFALRGFSPLVLVLRPFCTRRQARVILVSSTGNFNINTSDHVELLKDDWLSMTTSNLASSEGLDGKPRGP